MKLLTKTTLLYWLASLIGFSCAGYFVIQLMTRETSHEVDEQLGYEQELVAEFLESVDSGQTLAFPMVEVQELPSGTAIKPEVTLRDSTYIEEDEGEIEHLPLRIIHWQQEVNGKPYSFSLQRMLLEPEDALEAILWAMIPVVLVLSMLMALFLRFASQRLWRPFQKSLSNIATFRANDPQSPQFLDSTTLEFTQLNDLLKQMTDRVRQDYQMQKAFSENAAHELQTPLAIVQAKLEALIQSTDLRENDMETIQSALDGLQRMRRINQGLLLLTKIENQQFSDLQPLAIVPLFERHLIAVQELASLKGIEITFQASANPQLLLNPILADLLLNNLLANALQHNEPQGKVDIQIHSDHFSIANTANGKPLDPTKLYQRFQKQDPKSQGSGLGLAISERICTAMNLKITYAFQENMHNFRIEFPIQK